MSKRNRLRFRVDESGILEVVDPGWDCLDLLRTIDPWFEVQSLPLEGFTTPRFVQTRRYGCGLSVADIHEMTKVQLWDVHDDALNNVKTGKEFTTKENEASLLHIKIELASRILKKCTLCARRCKVDRTFGQMGECGLGAEAMVAEYYVHIGEEAVINPSLILNLSGCGLRCLYCQQGPLLTPSEVDGEPLDESLWDRLDTDGACSLSFAGGNPDESMLPILSFLLAAPEDWALPVVWNCHGYTTPETLNLLDGVVDVWLPDYKYHNNFCGQSLSGVSRYPDVACQAIKNMLNQDIPVIVRILVLPGHWNCCHVPGLEALAKIQDTGKLLISVRGQYCPDWYIQSCNKKMNRRVSSEEVEIVSTKARALGLTLADA